MATATGSEAINISNTIGSSSVDPFIDSSQSSSLTENVLPSDAASLRQTLLESGMSQSMLDQFSDQDLIQAYQEAFKE